jgi:hypothetical protein
MGAPPSSPAAIADAYEQTRDIALDAVAQFVAVTAPEGVIVQRLADIAQPLAAERMG